MVGWQVCVLLGQQISAIIHGETRWNVSAFAQRVPLPDALAIVQDMQRLKLSPNVRTYDTILRGCVRWGALGPAQRIWARMQQQGVKPSPSSFQYMVKILCMNSKLDAAWNVVALMQSANMEARSPVFSWLATACALEGDEATARKALAISEYVMRLPEPEWLTRNKDADTSAADTASVTSSAPVSVRGGRRGGAAGRGGGSRGRGGAIGRGGRVVAGTERTQDSSERSLSLFSKHQQKEVGELSALEAVSCKNRAKIAQGSFKTRGTLVVPVRDCRFGSSASAWSNSWTKVSNCRRRRSDGKRGRRLLLLLLLLRGESQLLL